MIPLSTRLALAESGDTSPEVLESLLSDPNCQVAHAARRTMRQRYPRTLARLLKRRTRNRLAARPA